MKFLGLLSGRKVEPESQPKESLALTYSLKIPGEKVENQKNENQKEITNGQNQKRPARKHLKLLSEMDKKEEKRQIDDEDVEDSDMNMAYVHPFEGRDLQREILYLFF